MDIKPLPISDCFLITAFHVGDARGNFSKIIVKSALERAGLEANFAEHFYSVSHQGVIRGFHFQSPPHDHAKLVYCIEGKILDAIVDLRDSSNTRGQSCTVELDSSRPQAVYVGRGMGHAFQAISKTAIVGYLATSEHAPSSDRGVRWDSVGVKWHDFPPNVSDRDRAFPVLSEVKGIFR